MVGIINFINKTNIKNTTNLIKRLNNCIYKKINISIIY